MTMIKCLSMSNGATPRLMFVVIRVVITNDETSQREKVRGRNIKFMLFDNLSIYIGKKAASVIIVIHRVTNYDYLYYPYIIQGKRKQNT